MNVQGNLVTILNGDIQNYIQGISVDCVVFGFHDNLLKVLLLEIPNQPEMALPGGYVMKKETLEDAANRVLKERTGIGNVFLQQFHVFSEAERVNTNFPGNFLREIRMDEKVVEWLSGRFITTGFYALVDYSQVVPTPDEFSLSCNWYDVDTTKTLMMDHNNILDEALKTLRIHLNYLPVGLNLLPGKFTIPELQKLYETILGKKLDRRNFQRKIKSYHILKDLKERKSGVAHKAPFLYSFDVPVYKQALKEGLRGGW